jgi:hypothetical protein
MGTKPLGLSEFDPLTRKELINLIETQAAQIVMLRDVLMEAEGCLDGYYRFAPEIHKALAAIASVKESK